MNLYHCLCARITSETGKFHVLNTRVTGRRTLKFRKYASLNTKLLQKTDHFQEQ